MFAKVREKLNLGEIDLLKTTKTCRTTISTKNQQKADFRKISLSFR